MHYISNEWTLGVYDLLQPGCSNIILEEVLIDFRELLGAHTGENMADTVWETMVSLGLVGKVSVGEFLLS
jgi:hypothetical protein